MGLEQYQGLFFLVSGFSFFVIMLLGLRLFSQDKMEKRSPSEVSDDGLGFEELEVVEVIQETHNIKSFRLRRKKGGLFPPFVCGQFISFQIGEDSSKIRSYSISSPERNRQVVQVSVKLLPEGLGSSWFHQLKEGDQVFAFPPSGHFSDSGEGTQERVLIAGGIGITPLLSILLSHLEQGLEFKMTLFYGVRTKADLAFHGLLEYLSQRHSRFDYYPVLSRDPDWEGDHGHLTPEYIKNKLDSMDGKLFYICGPDGMADPLVEVLPRWGVPEKNIFNEKFISEASFNEESLPERHLQVVWQGRPMEYKGKNNLLDFLESQGEALPYACRSGVCGSCKCRIRGPFKMLTQSGLTRKEQQEGYALACVSYPEGDIEVEL